MNVKTIFIYVVASLATLGSLYVGANSVYKMGVSDGVDKYHNFCYNNGTYIINEKPPHTIVDCSGLGELTAEQYADLLSGRNNVPKVDTKKVDPLTRA